MMGIDYIGLNDGENAKTVQITTLTCCCTSSAIHPKHQDQLKKLPC